MNQGIVTYVPTLIYIVYFIIVAAFIVLENRSPQSTFAWLFLFSIFPVIGLIIYLFLGRSWRAFAKEDELARQELGSDIFQNLDPILSRQREYFDRLATEKPTSFRSRLLRLVDSNSSSILTGYNRVEILQNASAKYPRLVEDIKQAQHSVHLNYYIWTNDDFTQQVKAALIERPQAGVEVRCLYDASGESMGKEYLQELKDVGVEIHPYMEYRSLKNLHTANYRSHRKIAVIDGRIGYVGGLNLDKDQLDSGKYFDSWRDTHLRIVGEAATALQASFALSWFNTTSQKLTDPAYFTPMIEEVDTFLPIQITQSGPDSQWAAIRQLYAFMMVSAEEKIYTAQGHKFNFFEIDQFVILSQILTVKPLKSK